MKYLIYFVLICLAVFFINKFLSRFKFPKVGAIAMFTGGVKTGKSAVSLGCAISNYKRVHRWWLFECILNKIFNGFRKVKRENPEEPLFYSSIPLKGIKYCPVTHAHLMREVRFNYKSVVFLDEASLIADSQLIKNNEINVQLLLFFKLFGHSTRGGKCIVNSHQISDLHYALKRVISQYFEIHHLSKYIPFVTVAFVREERYADDGSAINAYIEDVEDSQKRVLMWSSVFKRYDCYCFSAFTDNLPTYNNELYNGKGDSLKASEIISFRPEIYLQRIKGDIKDEKENG